MNLIAKIGEQTYEIAVESPNGDEAAAGRNLLTVLLDGEAHTVDLARIDDAGGLSLLLDGRPFDVTILPGGAGVRVGDEIVPVEVDEARRFRMRMAVERPAAAAGETICSPMPGKVVDIPVAVGDAVSAGQTVAIVEAMKMQNELTAAAAGVVTELKASAGQVVDSGDALVVISES